MPLAKQAVIAGGGPCGLAAALMLHQRGWDRITVLERNPSATAFDKNKGFNYLIDARGQRLLKQLGIAERLKTYGVENQRNIMTLVTADGEHKTFKSPFWDPARDSAFWSRRERLQALLFDRIMELEDSRIDVRFSHEFKDVLRGSDNSISIEITDLHSGKNSALQADLLLGCDGLKSAVREAMMTRAGLPKADFEHKRYPSPASKLYYKVLQTPSAIPLTGGSAAADDNTMAYAFVAKHTAPHKALALVAYPVATSEEPRTVNIIRLPDHAIWSIRTQEALFEFLEEALPQLPVRDVLSQQEARDFLATPPGKFPHPQYTKTAYAGFHGAGGVMPALLLGDAAHAFPPDLGLGVNAALEDVWHLSRHLDAAQEDGEAACKSFEKEQARERRALVRLVQTVAPYQYNHMPRKLKIWALKFFAVKALHSLLPFFIDKPAVLLAQQDQLPFTTIRQRQKLNRWKIAALILALAGIAGYLASKAIA